MPAWILSGYSGFFPHFKDMNVRLTGDFKLALGVNVSINCGISPCDGLVTRRPVTAGIGSVSNINLHRII